MEVERNEGNLACSELCQSHVRFKAMSKPALTHMIIIYKI